MEKSGEFDSHSYPESEYCEVVVNVVKHTVRCVNLGVQLSNHTGDEDHCQTESEEGVLDPLWVSPDFSTSNWSGGHVYTENNQYNHKLTSKKVSVEVVSFVGDLGGHVGSWVGVSVKFLVHWSKSYKGSLSSFNHGEP